MPAQSTRHASRGKTKKPCLSIHKGTGYWCKKIRGHVYYFGRVVDDPKGIAALEEWERTKADLYAGRDPEAPDPTKLTIEQLCFQFLAFHEGRRDTEEISPRTYQGLVATCKTAAEFWGRHRAATSLTPGDFGRLRTELAKTRKLIALGNEIMRVRSVFKFGFKNGLLPRQTVFGSMFDKPDSDAIDRAREAKRAEHGDRMFEAAELRSILAASGQPLRTMVLLAANCGYGQTDLSSLPLRAVNLDSGWVEFARVKTGRRRRCALWPQSVEAIRDWLRQRPKAKDPADAGLLFLTCRGSRWVKLNAKGTPADALGQEFDKVVKKLGLKRPGVSFYAIRHGFETVAGETGDQVAVDRVMGHKTPGMSSVYTERIGDDRLRKVAEHVRKWLFAEPPKDTTGPDGPKVEDVEPPQEIEADDRPALRLFVA